MKLPRYFLLIASVLLMTNHSAQAKQAAQDSLSLQDAIQISLKNQPSLDQVEAEINAAESGVNQAKTAYFPQVDVEGSYNYVDPVSSFDFNGNSLKVLPNNNYDAHVAARQLIYDFGKTRENIALARSKTLTAKQRREVVKWTISYYTAQTFYSVLYLDQSMKVVDEQLKTLNEDLDIAKKKRANGSATDYDVLSIKVRIGEEKNRKLDLVNQKQKLISTLRKLFGWEPGKAVLVRGKLELRNEEHISDLNKIYTNRPDYNVLLQQKKVLQQAYKLRSLSDRPNLTAGIFAGFKNGYQPDIKELLGNYSIGLRLKVPIFNAHITRYQKQEVQANINALNAQSRKLEREIQEQVEKAKTDVQTGKQKLETADLQIEQAKEQLRLAKIRYRNGVITNTDLLAAETALTRARFQKVTTTYNILLSQYDLKKAVGEKIWASN
ncbi:MAG: TolC family protein [Balneolaceae bacterium]|jgi:outer membrane protein TolC